MAELVGPSSLFVMRTPSLSCRILTASRIHLVVLSDSWAMRLGLVPADDVIFLVNVNVIADLFCSDCDCFLELLVHLRSSYA